MTASVDKFMRRLDRVEKDLLDASTKPRLAYSSIDGGTLEVKDLLGQTQALVGTQFDGSVTVASVGGSTPPSPTTPYVEPVVGGLMIYWDGTFVDNSPTRMDFRRVTFHAVTDVDLLDPLDPAQVVGEITIATGGQVTASLPPVEHFVFAVTWTDAGKFSVESDVAFGTPIEGSTSEQWQQHESLLTELNTVTLPALDGRLDAAEADVNTLETVTLPALQGELDANEAEVATLRDVTLPALDGRLDTAEGKVSTLETTTLPALDDRLAEAESEVNGVAATIGSWTTTGQTTIDGGQITADSVAALQLAANSVIAVKIATDAVVAGKIAADAISAREIQADAITAREIAANTITATEIAAEAITADEVAANAITAIKIAADAVTAGKIAADAISAREIQADAITATEIAAGAVTATAIAADAVTAEAIAANSIGADHIIANSINTAALAATAIDGMTITGALIRTAETGARVEISETGMVQYDTVGTLLTRIGGDRNKFSGSVDAEDITVRDGLELFGRENYFGPNSQVTLRTGQGGSNIPPSISIGYKTQAIGSLYTRAFFPLLGYHTDGVNESGVTTFFDESKIYASGNRYYNLSNIKATMSDGSLKPRWRPFAYTRIKNATGERAVFLAEFFSGGEQAGSYPTVALFALDDSVLTTTGSVAPLEKHGLALHTFSFNRSWALGRVIINTGHNAMAAYASIDKGNNDVLEFNIFEFHDGEPVGIPHNPADMSFAQMRVHADEKLVGVTYGMAHQLKLYTPAEGGDARCWVFHTTHQNIVVQDDAGLVRRPEWEWPVMPGTQHRVMAHGDIASNSFSYFANLTNSNNNNQPKQTLVKYSNWGWTQTTTPKWFSYAWRGHSSKNPEWLTPPSPKASFAPIKRAFATISIPPLPTPLAGQNQPRDPNADPYGWVLYHGAGTSEPVNASMYRSTLSPTGDPVTVQSVELESFLPASGANPLIATTGFPNASPSRIVSSAVDTNGNPLSEFDGDGNIKGKSLIISNKSISVGGIEQGVWYDYNIGSTAGATFRSGYVARYSRIGNTVHVQFRGTILSSIDSSSIRVPVPFPFGFTPAMEHPLGTGAVHNPGISYEVCVAVAATINGTHAVHLYRTIVANSAVSTSNPTSMSGDEIFGFDVTYEAAPLA